MKTKHLVVFISLFFLFPCIPSYAQNRVNLDAVAEEYIKNNPTPGIAMSVIKSDTILYGVAGVKRKGSPAAVTIDSKFHLGSCTKSIVAATAAKLVAEGKIKWESTLLEVLPEMEGKIRKEYYAITLENLLSHRGHIQPFDDTFSKNWRKMPKHIYQSENKLQDFALYVLNLEPAELTEGKGEEGAHRYSNAGFTIAALLLERSSGTKWETLVEEYCQAHGADCIVGFPNHIDKRDTYGHVKRFAIMKPVTTAKHDIYLVGPAGNVSVSIRDMAKIIQNNLKGLLGNDNVLKAETYQKLHFGLESYALGWYSDGVLKNYDVKYSMHLGSAGTFISLIIVIPKLDVAVVMMINSGNKNDNVEVEIEILRTLWKSYATY